MISSIVVLATPGTFGTAALTALFAVLVFVLGQIVQRLVIEPIQDQRRTKGKIVNALTMHQNTWLFRPQYRDDEEAKKKVDESANALSALAAEFRSGVFVPPWYDLWASMGFVPKRAVVFDVANQLLRWRALDEKQAMDAQERIMRLLGVSIGNDVARFGPTATADAKSSPEV